jgi:hypothetical protein
MMHLLVTENRNMSYLNLVEKIINIRTEINKKEIERPIQKINKTNN